MPTAILYLDTETKGVGGEKYTEHSMRIAWTCYARYSTKGKLISEKWILHINSVDMWTYVVSLLTSKQVLYIIAHNVFFDLQASGFFKLFTSWEWTRTFYYESGLTYILTIIKDKKTIRCLSSTNWYDTNLKGLGEMLGIPKYEVDFEHDDLDKIIDYCKRDVEIVKAAMEKYLMFIVKHDLGAFSMTKASQAWHAYRHRFMNHKIYIHDNKEIKALEREAYHGGRVECFELGKIKNGPFLSLDINSQYSYIMKQARLPTKLIDYEEDGNQDFALDCLKKFCCVAEIDVKTDLPMYPYHYNNKLVFPIGEFTTAVCSQGLFEAITRGHCLRIRRAAWYQSAVLFKDYVDYLYPFKDRYGEDGQMVMRELVKKMLNALYGKFGQKQPVVIEETQTEFEGYWRRDAFNLVTGEEGTEFKLFGIYTFQMGFEDAPMSFVAIPAHITEYARFMLWSIIESLGLENVLYIDTDSVKIRSQDLDKVKWPIDDHSLGALKVEEKFNRFEIIGPKVYLTEKVTKRKGVPVGAIEISPDTFEYDSFVKQKTHMKENEDQVYLISRTRKTLSRVYDKGIVNPRGRVTPHRVFAL